MTTTDLQTQPHFFRRGQTPLQAYSPGDDFYQSLIDLHRGLSEDQSVEVNAKLILILSNHIGDADVLAAALALARNGV